MRHKGRFKVQRKKKKKKAAKGKNHRCKKSERRSLTKEESIRACHQGSCPIGQSQNQNKPIPKKSLQGQSQSTNRRKRAKKELGRGSRNQGPGKNIWENKGEPFKKKRNAGVLAAPGKEIGKGVGNCCCKKARRSIHAARKTASQPTSVAERHQEGRGKTPSGANQEDQGSEKGDGAWEMGVPSFGTFQLGK